jgi:hypothetical protein
VRPVLLVHVFPLLPRVLAELAVLRDAAAAEEVLQQKLVAEIALRRDFQRKLVGLVRARGPFRGGLSEEQAAETYSALANPDLYLLLTGYHGWTAEVFQAWLADSLELLLLPPA